MGFLGIRINGKLYDYSSIEASPGISALGILNVALPLFSNVSDISYSDGLDPGMFRGTSAVISGRTRGTYEAEGSFTQYKEDYQKFISALALLGLGGYMEAEFDLVITYREAPPALIVVDTLLGCRIKHAEDSHSSGNDALVVKVDLSVFKIKRNGLEAVSPFGS